MFKIILGKIKPNTGTISFRNKNGQKIDQNEAKIGYIPQDPILFPDSIKNNITMFDASLNNKVATYINKFSFKNDIQKMPLKLETKLEVQNLNISGGLIYLDADGDGIDSNGTITMSGGTVLAMGSKNGGNGVLDFDRTFTFTGGILLAIGCRGMDQKPTAANGATAVASTIQTTTSSYVNVVYNEEIICTIKVTKQNQNYCVLAYGSDYSGSKVTITTSTENTLTNDLYFVK